VVFCVAGDFRPAMKATRYCMGVPRGSSSSRLLASRQSQVRRKIFEVVEIVDLRCADKQGY